MATRLFLRAVADANKLEAITQRIVEALRRERIALGLSQNQVAQRAGLNHTMVMRVEKRERIPRLDTLLRIADALDADLGSIISEASKGGGRKGH